MSSLTRIAVVFSVDIGDLEKGMAKARRRLEKDAQAFDRYAKAAAMSPAGQIQASIDGIVAGAFAQQEAARAAFDQSIDQSIAGLTKGARAGKDFGDVLGKKLLGTTAIVGLLGQSLDAVADSLERARSEGISFGHALGQSLNDTIKSLFVIGDAYRIGLSLGEYLADGISASLQFLGADTLASLFQDPDALVGATRDEFIHAMRSMEEARIRNEEAALRHAAAVREEQRAYEESMNVIAGFITGLQEEIFILENGQQAWDEAIMKREGASIYTIALYRELLTERDALLAEQEALDAATRAMEEHNAAVERAAESYEKMRDADAERIIDRVKTPLEKYNEQLDNLNDHLKNGRINTDQYNKAVKHADDEYNKALERERGAVRPIQSSIQAMNQLFTGRLGAGMSMTKDPTETTAKNTEEISDKTDTTNALLRELVTAVSSSEDAGVGF